MTDDDVTIMTSFSYFINKILPYMKTSLNQEFHSRKVLARGWKVCSIETKFYDTWLTKGKHAGKAASIFSAISIKFAEDGIPWENCVAVGVDNTNTN